MPSVREAIKVTQNLQQEVTEGGGLESSGPLKLFRGDGGGWNEPPLCPPGALWTGRCLTHSIEAHVVLRTLNLHALDLYGGPESSKRRSSDSHQHR